MNHMNVSLYAKRIFKIAIYALVSLVAIALPLIASKEKGQVAKGGISIAHADVVGSAGSTGSGGGDDGDGGDDGGGSSSGDGSGDGSGGDGSGDGG